MANILIIYSTTDGQTKKIGYRLQQIIEQQGHKATVVSVKDELPFDLTSFDKIVIGASIRYGKHSTEIIDFIKNNRSFLESKPNAFFSVNVVARKSNKSKPENNPYLQQLLQRLAWKPRELAVFAGKIDYPRYHFFDRFMIRLIMWITNGPTDPKAVVEFTDWKEVESFGQRICFM